ncbi:glycine zipper 2TM domain-containing protein [Sulfuriferula sp.]|uniref:glycine zipper 2TM domain-containing protein n=1 Tax=Sulfuriferula sp. TaxID=2025307 RepID=UPI00272EF095|nr:glycine zipper 2TM domain-containing protein [Sulfuriferula sp.]MDP2027507.1 glycine zipper 2TM domain-containing protein [Sulfuriferula sp.]
MNKTAVFLILAASVSAQAASFDDTARILSVEERTSQTNQRRQVCDNAQATSTTPGVGTLIGAVAGGVLGAQVGKGNGRTAAAATGAVVGALTGNHLEKGTSGAARNCYQSNDYETRVIGYSVTYDYGGRVFTQFMPAAPTGDTLKVRVNLTAQAVR